MAEWSIALPWKGSVGVTLPWVRIPLSPPIKMNLLKKIERKGSVFLKKITEFPLIELGNSKSNNMANQTIPPNVFQTWEDNLFGKTHYKELIKFRKVNHDLNFFIFDKVERNEYMKTYWCNHPIYKIYIKSVLGNMKSDIFRFCILYERGGYYFDISKGCSVQLSTLHDYDAEGIITNEPVECSYPLDGILLDRIKNPFNNFVSWGMGFKKQHNIVKDMIDSIVKDFPYYYEKKFHNPKSAILSLMSTGQFTKVVRKYFYKNNDPKIVQSGVYFNKKGIFSMKGSSVRNIIVEHYSKKQNIKIFN